MATNAGIDFHGSGGIPIHNETPSGTINGSNDTFALAHTPNPPTSLLLFKSGLLQRAGGNDYTLTGGSIVFEPSAIPASGDSLMATYSY